MFSGFPAPIIGEHINGVLARHCMWEGNRSFRRVIRSVTSSDYELNNKYFWRENFEKIWRLYEGILPREQLLASHTAFRFNSRFLPKVLVQDISEAATNQTLSFSGVKNIAFNNVWRWCPVCVEQDKLNVGTRYWHVIHQIPTILRCPSHEVKLIYGCTCKGYHLTKLANHPLPPNDKKCPLCHKIIQTNIVGLSDEELWLELLTLEVLKKKPQSRLNKIKNALKVALSLPNSAEKLSKSHRVSLRKYQRVLDYLVLDWHYKNFFEFPNFNHEASTSPFCINLTMLIYSNKYFAPLSYIASLRMFYSQSEVENILLGEHCGL